MNQTHRTDRTALFETAPVHKAVATLALPAILSQLVSVVYNLADTFFIGQTGDPLKVAAVALAFPAFMLITAIANLFGIGGGSLTARLLGAKRADEVRHVSSFSFYGCIAAVLVYSLAVFIFLDPILRLLGASDAVIGYAREYLMWVAVAGGLPTATSLVCAHLIRGEGRTAVAARGIAAGGILNIILDPLFIFTLNMGVAGAAAATMLSNAAVAVYFLLLLRTPRDGSKLSISPRDFRVRGTAKDVLYVGFPAAVSMALVVAANAVIVKLAAAYGDIPVAAFGIVKKVDSIIVGLALGLGQGILPIAAYNYASGNLARMKKVCSFALGAGMAISLLCIIIFEWQADGIMALFINDAATIETGGRFLRAACLATPFILANYLINTVFQAMGKGGASLLFSLCRQGIINIPLLFLMNTLLGMMGLVWTQLISDALTFVIGVVLYIFILKKAAGSPQPD